MQMQPFLHRASRVGLALALVGTLVCFTFDFAVAEGDQARVPDIRGLSRVQAETALREAGLAPRGTTVQTTEDTRKFARVSSQEIQPGAVVNRETTVPFGIYIPTPIKAGQKQKVPWIINKTRFHAEDRLFRRGLIPKPIAGNQTNDPGLYDRVYKQNIHDRDSEVNWGTEVEYRYFTSKAPMGPFDANSPDRLPNLIPSANGDDSFDIAWSRRDGKIFVSHYTGRAWRDATHTHIPNALDMLSGFAKDNQGNKYIATMRKELAPKWRWDEGYSRDVAHILKLPVGRRQAELFVDLNQKQFVPKQPIVNPSLTGSAYRTTARMAFGNNTLALFFDVNNGAWNNIHNAARFTTVGMDKSNRGTGGGPHCMDLRLMFDGNSFVAAQAFEDGIALGKMTTGGNSRQWHPLRLIFKNPLGNGGFTQIAGVAKTSKGYLMVCAYGRGQLNSTNNVEWNGITPQLPLYVTTVPTHFENEPHFDRQRGVTGVIRGASTKLLIRPETDQTVYVRPKLVSLQDGKYMVLCEERNYGRGNGYRNTTVVLIDETGNILRGPKKIAGAPMQMSNEAFLLPRSGNAAWVAGDAANAQILLHTLDENLTHHSYPLPIPR